LVSAPIEGRFGGTLTYAPLELRLAQDVTASAQRYSSSVKICCTMLMYMKVIPIGEARRRLSRLVRSIAGGSPPVAIGRRGKVEAILTAPDAPTTVRPLTLKGMFRLIGPPEDLQCATEELRREAEESIRRTARYVERPPPRRRRPRR
jgi:antitoxin (DNA-binding transcriptional repressor) of toxin-antitoxin stability system